MLKPGDLVGPYEIRGFVGQGGMGRVYRAFDPRLERTVALKIIATPESTRATPPRKENEDSDSDADRSYRDLSNRMLREARAVASLSHPNVVAIYDVGESNGRLYLAMEYVVGASLRNLIGNFEVPLERRIRWLVDVAHALEAAHRTGIIHRDIKPENVMVRDDGGVKVLDFGIARRTASRAPSEHGVARPAFGKATLTENKSHAVDTVTGQGSIAGTPLYMAPEQLKGGDVDARCDQFAWGVMAYELVTYERPWTETGDVLHLVASILKETPRSIRSKTKDVPSVVEQTIMRALEKDPTRRFPSMGDIADALEPFASLTSGGDRVRIMPHARAEDDPAYAATTRVPTALSIGPSPADETARRTAPPPRARALSLALPLLLLAALGVTVYVVKTRNGSVPAVPAPASAPRPLSTIPQAETAYKEAMSLWRDGAIAKARDSLGRAIELDPTFAAAHLELALQQASANDPPAAQASFHSAFEHRHMLLPRDEHLLEASEPFIRANPDLEEWETRMSSAVFRYPRDPELQYYLGRARQQQGDHERAKAAFNAATRLDDGFIPALAGLAKTDMSLGNIAEGLASTERCIKRSPVASTCVETRYELLLAANECNRAKDEATRWSSLEPRSPRPLASLARALHADGAPRLSVEEVLSRRWSLIPLEKKRQEEVWDRALLAVLDGDFVRAEELARELDRLLPHTADVNDHARPGWLRVNVLMETDRMRDAANAARTFLDRMAAWPANPLVPDPSIAFLEPLYRAGELTKHDLEEKRASWLDREHRRTNEGRPAHDPWTSWATAYGSFADSRDEAVEAIARAPAGPAAIARELSVDLAIGKVYALLGRWDEAMPHLEQVINSCATFDGVMLIAKARLYLGQAQEAKGDLAAAKATYEKIVETWPKASTSRTVKYASDRLAMITRD